MSGHGPAPHPDLTGLILDAIAEGVFTVDQDLIITSFNRAAAQITGVPATEALGRKCHQVLGSSVCQAACPLRRSMQTGHPSAELEVELRAADGRIIPARIRTAVLRDATGRLLGGVETFRDISAERHLQKRISAAYTFCDIKGKSAAMTRLFAVLPDVAASRASVLISGESGTGKELVARALHDLSDCHEGPFVAVNCGAIPEALVESELFGHLRGAFTGAQRQRVGRFAAADGGTLFLDEIGELPLAVQAKLLRALDRGEITPLGADVAIRVRARVLAATNRDLEAEAAAGRFRSDLYYRLNVLQLRLPPLRQRREDIPLLAGHFLERLAAERCEAPARLSESAMALLLDHQWPGNVRELENALEHAVVLARGGTIEPRHLPEALRRLHGAARPAEANGSATLDLAQRERQALIMALETHGGHRAKAAAALGVSTTTLWRKMKRLGLANHFK